MADRRAFLRLAGAGAVISAWPAWAREGVEVGPPSSLSQLVPAEQVERAATGQYASMLRQAAQQRAVGPDDHPQVRRLRAIANRIIPFTPR
jgi:hypothetical protein